MSSPDKKSPTDPRDPKRNDIASDSLSTRSSPEEPPEYYAHRYGCYQFTPGLALAQMEMDPAPITRTHSTPEPYGPLRHRACSAFRSASDGGKLLHQRSDPGFSAFRPVDGSSWRREEDDESRPAFLTRTTRDGERADSDADGKRGKKASPPRAVLGSRVWNNLRGMAWKNRGRRKTSGRENPVSLLAEEGEDTLDDGGERVRLEGRLSDSSLPAESAGRMLRATSVDMYSDSDFDDDIMEPIVGQYHLLDEEPHSQQYPRPPSVELPSVEVVAEGSLPSSLSLDDSRENVVVEELRTPGRTEAATIRSHRLARRRCEEIPESEESPAYHPLLDHEEDYDDEEGDGEARHDDHHVMTNISGFPLQLSYQSPQSNTSPDNSNKSSSRQNRYHSPSSHDSRLSGSNSRTTNSGHTDSSQADYEVRQANRRRSSVLRNREEVVVDLDGNATVHSSSTTSSNYHVHSPKMREGACLPVERFFAGGNVVLTPRSTTAVIAGAAEEDDLAEMNISKFLSLSPKKSMRNRDAGAHSPHTVSSASVSNTSSSGSETKKPLKFVAYQERRESPTKTIVDCSRLTLEENDEHSTSTPVTKRTVGALIKPRISTGAGQRPPIQHFTSYQKPPQSPRKDSIRGSGTRTPTRTPPPARENGSGATTPSSPPVIVDGPNVMRGDWKYREGTKKPHVVRGSHGGLRLLPPSSELLYRHTPRERSPSGDRVTLTVEDGANDGAREVITASFVPKVTAYSLPIKSVSATVVTPDKRAEHSETKNAHDCKNMHHLAMVSPDKQG
ncbi:hypothetical protein ACHAWX_006761 [Stephanocyclus meneghinianus]